jgi:hypothetical protein
MIGQDGTEWVFRTRFNGDYQVTQGGVVQLAVTHVVGVRDAAGVRLLYVDGSLAAMVIAAGALETADLMSPLAFANEAAGERQWHGKLVAVTVFARALSASEVSARFVAGAK